jgi:uncharacterized protein (TIGR02145 family)
LEKEIATNPGKYSLESDTLNPAWNVAYEGSANWRPSGDLTLNGWGRRMKSPTKVTSTVAATNGASREDGTGFNALLVGDYEGGLSNSFGLRTHFWSSSANGATVAWRRYMLNSSSGVIRSALNKEYLFSVRCKK